MKQILTLLVVIFSTNIGAMPNLDNPIKIDRYENKQGNTVWLQTHFGEPLILNAKDSKTLEGKTIYHVDLIYTSYHESTNFDQNVLNIKRIDNLKRSIPNVLNKHVKWSIYEQTGANDRATAKGYFHGFVVHYGDPISYQAQSAYFGELTKPFSTIEIINETGGSVQYMSGTIIDVDAFSVVDENGTEVKGSYTLYYREFRNQAEILASGIPMTYDEMGAEEVFNSLGMYEIRAKQKGKDLVLQRNIEVHFQCTDILPDASFFAMDEEGHWSVENSLEFRWPDFSFNMQDYLNEINGNEGGAMRIHMSRFKPENDIDQGSFQGYSRIKQSMVLDKDQVYAQLSRVAWRKFQVLYETQDSIKNMVDGIDKEAKRVLVYQRNAIGFLEAVMGQDFDELEVERKPNKDVVYRSGITKKGGGLRPIEDRENYDDHIENALGLVSGLTKNGFGVYNCDQTKRIEDPIALQPVYFNQSTGNRLDSLFLTCVIDLDLNASLSYHPNHLVCNDRGNTKLLIFAEDKRIYLFDKSDFSNIELKSGPINMVVREITNEVSDTDDLARILKAT